MKIFIFSIFLSIFLMACGAHQSLSYTSNVVASCSVQSNGAVLWNDSYNKEADWQSPTNKIIENIVEIFGKHFWYKKITNN